MHPTGRDGARRVIELGQQVLAETRSPTRRSGGWSWRRSAQIVTGHEQLTNPEIDAVSVDGTLRPMCDALGRQPAWTAGQEDGLIAIQLRGACRDRSVKMAVPEKHRLVYSVSSKVH